MPENRNSGRLLVAIPILFTIISFLYTIVTGTYNGDFMDATVTISFGELFFLLIISLLPFILLWKLYKNTNKDPKGLKYKISLRKLWWLFIALSLWHVFVTIQFGVGVMLGDNTTPSGIIGFITQILNRVPVLYVGLIILLIKPSKTSYFVIASVVAILSLLHASLGDLINIIFMALLLFYDEISKFCKKHVIIVLLFGGFVVPYSVGYLFEVRQTLRGKISLDEEKSYGRIVFGQFTGRMSSFSNQAYIYQEYKKYKKEAEGMESSYYLKETLGTFMGVGFLPRIYPDKILSDYNDEMAIMAGIPGNIMFILMKSDSFHVVMAGLLYIFLIWIAFKVSLLFQINKLGEVILFLLIVPVTSGVYTEIASISVKFFVIFIIYRLFISKQVQR